MGRGGGEGRVPSLMTAAVEREKFTILISFLSSLMCRPWDIRLKRERSEVSINPDSSFARCQNREGHSPLAMRTSEFVHILVLLAADFALCFGARQGVLRAYCGEGAMPLPVLGLKSPWAA